jgi:hypothetical protein
MGLGITGLEIDYGREEQEKRWRLMTGRIMIEMTQARNS